MAIRSVVERHRACNARVFGSVLHGTDLEGSDLDILIDPTPDTTFLTSVPFATNYCNS
jgi:predicted nucleotidyltransferase